MQRPTVLLLAVAALLVTAALLITAAPATAEPLDSGAPSAAASPAPRGGPAVDAPRWDWPVASHRVLRGFEAPAAPWAAGHRGIDLQAAAGDPVRAVDDGVVAFAGTVVDRGVVSIDHAGVRSTVEPVTPEVSNGEQVHRGQVVARVSTGGPHPPGVLYLSARVPTGDGWAYVSPLLWLGGAQRAVLLPLSAFAP